MARQKGGDAPVDDCQIQATGKQTCVCEFDHCSCCCGVSLVMSADCATQQTGLLTPTDCVVVIKSPVILRRCFLGGLLPARGLVGIPE